MVRRRWLTIGLAAVAIAAVAVTGGTAGASPRASGAPEAVSTFTVSKTTGLADREVVNVSWAGAQAHAPLDTALVRVGMCLAGATNAEDCDFEGQGSIGGVPVGSVGGLVTSATKQMAVAVDPFIDSTGQVDCRVVACAVGISDGLGAFPAMDIVVPVSFATTPVHQPDVTVGLHGSSSVVGGDVYAGQATGAETAATTIAAGGTRRFDLAVQNDGTASEGFKLKLTTTCGSTYRVQVLHGATDVTAAAIAGTTSTGALAAGASTAYQVKIRATSATPTGATCSAVVTARSTGTVVKDAVRAKVKRT